VKTKKDKKFHLDKSPSRSVPREYVLKTKALRKKEEKKKKKKMTGASFQKRKAAPVKKKFFFSFI
jgi:hypothetical protein